MGRKVLLPVLSAPCRVRLVLLSLYCGTSFQHALYRLMRNLLKISSCAAGVNGGAPKQCICMLASVVNVCALSPTMALNSAPPHLRAIGCDGSCRRRYRLTRAKPSQHF